MNRILSLLLVVLLVFPALAQQRKTSLMADAYLQAIVREAAGNLVKDSISELGRFHRVQASPGFHEAAVYIAEKARLYGLEDVKIEAYPADGTTVYNTFRSYQGWEAQLGLLTEISPRNYVIADYSKLHVALADYSNDADVTTQLIDVNTGLSEKDYLGKDVKGKIVLAGGNVAAVHKEAVEKRGAAGILSYQQNQVTGWSGDYPDNVRWGHLSPYNIKNRFAFMISLRQARTFQARLANGEQIQLQASVRARVKPSQFEVVTGIIRGTDASAGEIAYSCHLCHQKPGANDNASGAATILEDARILSQLIKIGKLPRPRRTIRFIWPPEIAGTACYFARNPDIVKRMRAAIHMDMVGGSHQVTKAILHLTRTPASLPSYVNDVAAVFGEYVIQGSRRAAMEGDFSDALIASEGTKEILVAEPTSFTMGSDHEIFQEGSFRIPTIYLNDWPDVFIHTNNDSPANMDATKLQRVAVIGAAAGYFLAAATEPEAKALAGEVFARGGMRQHEALRRAIALATSAEKDANAIREARNIIIQAARQERETITSIGQLVTDKNFPTLLDELIKQIDRREAEAISALAAFVPITTEAVTFSKYEKILPKRTANVVGNMNIYYYDYISDRPGTDGWEKSVRLTSLPNGDTLMYETLNLVDGKRDANEIRNILSAAYGSVPEDAVVEYLKLLEKIGVVTLIKD
ncbi:MAG: DUF4910 domain-containing protein [Acidobacteriota bacterium]